MKLQQWELEENVVQKSPSAVSLLLFFAEKEEEEEKVTSVDSGFNLFHLLLLPQAFTSWPFSPSGDPFRPPHYVAILSLLSRWFLLHRNRSKRR